MKIIFPSNIYERLRAYVLAVDTEISFLGKEERIGDTIIINDIALFKQESTYGSTILDRVALGKLYDNLMDKGENPSNWKTWIHSHAGMNAYFSGKDKETIESFDLEHPVDNWFLSVVVNHAGDLQARIDVFSPFRHTIDKLSWDIVFTNPLLSEQVKREIEEKVTTIEYRYNEYHDWRKELEALKRRGFRSQILLPNVVD